MIQARFHTIYAEPNGERVEIPALKGKDAEVEGNYELISSFTLTENSSGFLIDKYPNGEPLALKKAIIVVKYPERTGEMALSLAVNTNTNVYTNQNALIRMSFSGTSKGVILFKAFMENGLAFGELVFAANVSDNSPNNGNLNRSTKYLNADYIRSIALTSYQTDIIPKNTTVNILGVRA